MPETQLHNTVRRYRRDVGLSQEALGDRVGVSRHAIMAIEAGRQVPSTTLALRLAATFDCAVKDLFHLDPVTETEVRLPPPRPTRDRLPRPSPPPGWPSAAWVAGGRPIPFPRTQPRAADAIVVEGGAGVRPDAPSDGDDDARQRSTPACHPTRPVPGRPPE